MEGLVQLHGLNHVQIFQTLVVDNRTYPPLLQVVYDRPKQGVVHILVGIELAQQTLGRDKNRLEVLQVRVLRQAATLVPCQNLEVERSVAIALLRNGICHVTKFLVQLPYIPARTQLEGNS